jgi:hypothetical protein
MQKVRIKQKKESLTTKTVDNQKATELKLKSNSQ